MSGALNSLERLVERAEGDLDLIHQTLVDAMASHKDHRVRCRNCNRYETIQVDDTSARVRAAEVMTKQLKDVAELLAKAKAQQGTSGPDWGILHGYPLETKEAAYQKLQAELQAQTVLSAPSAGSTARAGAGA